VCHDPRVAPSNSHTKTSPWPSSGTSARVSVQVLPFSSPGCASLLAPFVVASFAPDPRADFAYLDK